MGLFSDIFDDLSDTVDTLFSNSNVTRAAIGLGGALLSGSSSQAGSEYNARLSGQVSSEQRIASRLQEGVLPGYNKTDTEIPIHSRNQFDAVKSVDPFTLEDEWHNRLMQYANITRQTGVSQTGK